jgi:hypothetical protein
MFPEHPWMSLLVEIAFFLALAWASWDVFKQFGENGLRDEDNVQNFPD